MAFNYRTPREEVAQRLTGEYASAIMDPSAKKIIADENESLCKHFSFAVPVNAKKWLTKWGVELSTHPFLSHSHPVCKVIENHILFRVLPHILDANRNMSLLGIKENKVKNLKKFTKGKLITDMEPVNRLVTSRDNIRYGSSTPIRRLKLEKNSNLFIHDELHYWTMGQLDDFLSIYRPNKLIASFVFPVEVLFGYESSLLPFVYSYSIENGNLIFSPDGKLSESYEQPMSSGDILRLSSIKTQSGDYYSVDIAYTIGAHHVLSIVKSDEGSTLLETRRRFGPYPSVDAGCLFNCKGRVPLSNISIEVLQKIILYLFSLKKPDVESATAKLRQLMNDEVDLDTMWVVRDLTSRIQGFKSKWSEPSIRTILGDWLKDMCPIKKTAFKFRMIDDFERNLMNLKPLTFVLTKEVERELEVEDDIFEMESRFFYNKFKESTLYSGAGPKLKIDLSRFEQWSFKPNTDHLKGEWWVEKDWPLVLFNKDVATPEKEKEGTIPVNEEKKNKEGSMSTEKRKGKAHINPPQVSGISIGCEDIASTSNSSERAVTYSSMSKSDVYEFGCMSVSGFEIPSLKSVQLKGRKAAFYATDDKLAYFHDKVIYLTNSGSNEMDYLLRAVSNASGHNFNTALIQWYEENSTIPLHRDDEDCYDDNPILNWNLSGSASFKIIINGETIERHLKDEEFILLNEKANKVKHSVKATSKRISITFRLQRRQISLGRAINAAKDRVLCLIDAISSGCQDSTEKLCSLFPDKVYKALATGSLDVNDAGDISKELQISFTIQNGDSIMKLGTNPLFHIDLIDGHFKLRKSSTGTTTSISGEKKDRRAVEADAELLLKLLTQTSNAAKVHNITPNKDSAVKLVESFWSGATGVNCSIYKDEGFRLIPGSKNAAEARRNLSDLESSGEVRLVSLLGFAGSGKSYSLQQILRKEKTLRMGTLLISPRLRLKDDWVEKVPELHCCTFESAIKMDRRRFHSIILDEVNLLPNGYVDLIILLTQGKGTVFYLLGDPLQSTYHSDQDKLRLSPVDNINSILGDMEVPYLMSTRRCGKTISKALGVPTFSMIEGISTQLIAPDLPTARAHLKGKGLKAEVILVSSRLDLNRFEGERVMTFGESQGLTFDSGVILLTEETRLNSDNQLIVALTRFKSGFVFIFAAKGTVEQYKANSRGVLARVLNNFSISEDYYKNMTKLKLNMIKPTGAGTGTRNQFRDSDPIVIIKTDEADRELRLAGDPWLKGLMDLSRAPARDEELFESFATGEHHKVHLPRSGGNKAKLISELVMDKYSREIKTEAGSSNQFREARRASDKNNFDLPQCSTAESIYMSHSMKDDITFWSAVKKRIKFATPEKNYRKLEQKTAMGEAMLREFLKKVPVDVGRDNMLLEDCKREFEATKLSKSQKLLEMHSSRSDPDTKEDEVKLFLKSQMCTKFEKRFCEGKAGQTIACFHHNVLVKFSPFCRYMEKKISDACKKTGQIYIHQKKNFNELNKFIKENYQGGICVESDYEAYDKSQDATVLAFELALMRHMGINDEFIQDYLLMKCTLGSKLGSLAIMRFTGEFCTFLFNTLANIAFTCMRYHWSNETVLFAGDDMCALGNMPIKTTFDDFFSRLTLKAKVNRVNTPMFCGWRLTPHGLFKEPALLFDRLSIAKEKDRLHECLNSYFEEFFYAYSMGSYIEVYMDEEQMELHYLCVRFFLRHENKLSERNRAQIHTVSSDASEYESD